MVTVMQLQSKIAVVLRHIVCCGNEHPAMKMPPSLTTSTLQQSSAGSDSSSLQSNTSTPRIILPPTSSDIPIPSTPNLSSKFAPRPKHGSSSSKSWSLLTSSMYDHINHLQHGSSSNSPYYKGLLDQSLAILDGGNVGGSCTPPPQACYPIPMITASLNLHLSSGHSPYYKGLTDHSLVIGTSCCSRPTSPDLPIHHHQSTNLLSCHQSSPYYRGLIDYSLVLHGSPSHTTHSHYSSSIVENPSSPSVSTLNDLITTTMCNDDAFLITEEKKPLRDDTAVESKQVSEQPPTLEEIIEMEMELVTKGEEAIMVGSVLLAAEEDINADKRNCSLNKEMRKRDNVEFVIEEKPLRERVLGSDSEAISGKNASLVQVDGNADKTTILEDQMELDIIITQGKPLRERVSDSDAETTRSLKEAPVLVSEQTVVVPTELPCKEGQVTKDTENVYEYTWAAKHQPMTLEGFICNRDKALQLKALVKEGCGCNHFIFEGPPNVGKRSMIRAMLREVFGADKMQVTKECKVFNLKGEMVEKLQVQIKKSEHHVEVNLSETQGYEKHVIVELFKDTYGNIINNSLPCSPENCQAIILYEAEKLSKESMLYIKWLLEKYKGCNKVFFCCSDQSKLQPLKPLCNTVRLSPPSTQEILRILEYIGEQEGIKLSRNLVKKIILRSKNNNLRQAIRSLEATCRNKDALKDDDLILTGWEFDILNIAKLILEEQTPRQLYLIRRKLQSLMIHDVPPSFVYKSLVAELTSLVDASLRSGVAKLDKDYNIGGCEVEYDHETAVKQLGAASSDEATKRNSTAASSSSYLKVEEFIAKFMSWYKNWTSKK